MKDQYRFELRCTAADCTWVEPPLADTLYKGGFARAYAAALDHAWNNRGHHVQVFYDGRVVAAATVAEANPWRETRDKVERLREQIVQTRREAVAALKHYKETGQYPVPLSQGAAVLIGSVPSDPSAHTMEHHCLVDEESGTCVVCGVGHDVVCATCGGRGYHRLPCILISPRRAIEPIQSRGGEA